MRTYSTYELCIYVATRRTYVRTYVDRALRVNPYLAQLSYRVDLGRQAGRQAGWLKERKKERRRQNNKDNNNNMQ